MEYITQFIAKLLEHTGSDSEALFVGDAIVTLIKKGNNSISSVPPNLLTAVLGRLIGTGYQPFIQSLVMVFAI